MSEVAWRWSFIATGVLFVRVVVVSLGWLAATPVFVLVGAGLWLVIDAGARDAGPASIGGDAVRPPR